MIIFKQTLYALYTHLRVTKNFPKLFKISACLLIVNLFTPVIGQTFPPGFSQVAVATVYYPTSMAMAPDGRIFCTEKAGKVKIIKNGVVLPTLFLQLSVNQEQERGLSSIALDPDFSSNNYVYIYYTTASSPIRNRLSRFTASGDVAVAGSETVLLEFEPLVNTIHNGGGMVFGPDGKLYIGIGNDNVNSNSQTLNNYKGKVLRINKDGSVPAGNPFNGTDAANRIWAYGLRNPWSLAIQPGTGKIFVGEVGEGAWEEINDATTSGKNFGWPAAEGNSSNTSFVNPVYTYHHGAGTSQGCAISGGDFFSPASTNYPSQYTGKYFFIDYCNQWINYIDPGTGTKYDFASNLPGANNCIKTGKDGNLYYFSIGQDKLYRIIYSSNSAPAITSQPSNVTVSGGLPATFNVSASGATPLNYQWQKNNQNIAGANASSYVIQSAQPADAGTYKAIVSNSFGSATSNDAVLTVNGQNTKPQATILTPAASNLYRGGDVISFSGDATDPEDGSLPASSYQWIIDFHHDNHFHPGPFVPPGVKSGTFYVSPDGEKSGNVWYRFNLVVTDSQGATDTAKLDMYPKKTVITMASDPPGINVLFNDQPETATYSVQVVAGMKHGIGVISPQNYNDSIYIFDHWMHGGPASQLIIASDTSKTYTAVLKNTHQPIGIKEQPENVPIITLYPNPNTGAFTYELCLNGLETRDVSLKVITSTGKQVYSKLPTVIDGCLRETVNLKSTLPAGIYILQIKAGNSISTKKIILSDSR